MRSYSRGWPGGSVLPNTACTGAMACSSSRMSSPPTSPAWRMSWTPASTVKTSGRSMPWVSEISPMVADISRTLERCSLRSSSHVDGRDAEGQRGPRHVGEARTPHALGELLLLREAIDGFRQVVVRRRMPTDEPPDRRQDAMEVQSIDGSNYRQPGRRELEDDEPGTRGEDAQGLAKPGVEIGEVADAEGDDGAPRRPVAQRKGQC